MASVVQLWHSIPPIPCSVLEIRHFSYPVYHTFLKYLYTDDIQDLSPEDLTGGMLWIGLKFQSNFVHLCNLSLNMWDHHMLDRGHASTQEVYM